MPITQGALFDPHTACPEMEDALQARVHDPLWFLARQWQFGELQGQDTASPVQVGLQAEIAPLTRYRPGNNADHPVQTYTPATLPLETLVEREVMPAGMERDLGLLAEASLHFLRLLAVHGADAYRDAYRSLYPFPAPTAVQRRTWDAVSLRRLDLLA